MEREGGEMEKERKREGQNGGERDKKPEKEGPDRV